MYVPRSFVQADRPAIAALLRDHDFATLVTVDAGAPFVTHLPLLHVDDSSPHGKLVGHMARANPQWRHFTGGEACAVFTGPHAYVSPRWYASAEQVPTWNYAAVHASGTARILEAPAQARAAIEALVARHERGATAWRIDELPAAKIDQLLAAIVAFELPIARLEAKWKVGQNRAAVDRLAAADVLAGSEHADARAIAALMRGVAVEP